MFNNIVFPDKLVLVYLEDEEWLVKHPYTCSWDGGAITVPKGFSTDLSSIPRIFRSIIPVVGEQNGPSVIHDYCYVTKWRSRKESDRLFYEGCKAAGVHWLRRQILFSAIRLGGWAVWNKR